MNHVPQPTSRARFFSGLLVDDFFAWLAAQASRISRKSDLGNALHYMLRRQDGFRLFVDDGHVDMDSNLVENAIRSPAMNVSATPIPFCHF